MRKFKLTVIFAIFVVMLAACSTSSNENGKKERLGKKTKLLKLQRLK